MHVAAQARRSISTTCARSPRSAPRVPALRHHDGRRLQLRRRGGRGSGGDRAARDRLSRGLRPATPRRSSASTSRERASSPRSPIGCGSASRRTRRTPARSSVYEACAALGLPTRRISPRAPRSATGSSTARATGPRSRELLVPPPGETGIRLLAEAGLLGPRADGGALRPRRRRGDRAARRARRRRRALPALERVPRLRRRAARRAARGRRRRRDRDRQPRLDAVVRPLRGDARRRSSARARARRAPRR